jgi:DNA-binding transcriptional regulator YdaS (Cro superfamily)
MTKKQALKLFGGLKPMAEALGISRQAIDQWPKILTQKQADWVLGALMRLGLIKR